MIRARPHTAVDRLGKDVLRHPIGQESQLLRFTEGHNRSAMILSVHMSVEEGYGIRIPIIDQQNTTLEGNHHKEETWLPF